jgi:Transposase DDE domain group 1
VGTDCSSEQLEFQGLGSRRVVAGFDAGRATSDGGVLLLREVVQQTGLLRDFAGCFRDYRNPALIEHSVEELVSQRVLGQALGYEDLNDHDWLRDDALFAVGTGKDDPTGSDRRRERDRGHPLAAHATLNRLELTPANADKSSRYHKVVYDAGAIDQLLVDAFLRGHAQPPQRIVLDLDATDDPLHGQQEGRFFHGYYRSYCYLPLYIFCGDFLLCARLRRSNIDASAGSVEELERIIGRIRQRWPEVEIWIRADSGFAREAIMHWCEENRVQYVLGLARNARRGGARRGNGRGQAAPRAQREAGADLQGLLLPDPRHLEPLATRGGQGRVAPRQREPPLRGQLALSARSRGGRAL